MMSIGRVGTDDEEPEATDMRSFDIEEDDEFEEVHQLVPSGNVKSRKGIEEYFSQTRKDSSRACMWLGLFIILAFVGSTVFLKKNSTIVAITAERPPMKFTCPASGRIPPLNYDESFEEDYEIPVKHETRNATQFLLSAKAGTLGRFDGWGRTYNQMKEVLYDWKKSQFAPHLEDGFSIYESACGHGLNLYATLEIVNEVKGVENLVVYGNEYVPAAAAVSNGLIDEVPPAKAKKGTICAADSTNLDFVPANAFDLVYTGYISTLLDPLHFDLEYYATRSKYKALCRANETDWEAEKLRAIFQERQEDWMALWVTEMVRIAKPGAPVIVESIAPPYCEILYDYGGLSKDFWARAIDKYGWDVNPASVVFGNDMSHEEERYHVALRKNK